MLIDGWQINENELHGFDPEWRTKWHAHDLLFECKSADIACLIYSNTEIRMNRLVGRLAVYECKTDPALLVNPRHFLCCFWDADVPVEYSQSGRILFVKGSPHLDRSVAYYVMRRILSGKGSPRSSESASFYVMDLDCRRFAVIDKGEPSFAPAVHEISERTFRLDFYAQSGEVESAPIDLDELEWHDLRKL